MSAPLIHHVLAVDDINQILKVVKNSPGIRICLIIDEANHILRNGINMRLLKAYMKEFSTEVCLVTKDKVVIKNAYDHGVLSYSNAAEAFDQNKALSPEDHLSSPVKKPGINRLTLIIVTAVCCLVLIGFLFLPRVYLKITPVYQKHTLIAKISGVPEHTQTSVQTQAVLMTSGKKSLGVNYAKGTVVFHNESNQAVLVPAGTVVETLLGFQFITDYAISVPPQEITYFLDVPVGKTAGRKEVSVTAVLPGTAGNVLAGDIREVRLDNPHLIVRNSQPMTGGSDVQVNCVAEEDIQNGVSAVEQGLDEKVHQMIRDGQNSRPDKVLIGWEVVNKQVRANLSFQETGDELIAELTATVNLYWLSKKELDRQIDQAAAESIPDGYKWLKVEDNRLALIDCPDGSLRSCLQLEVIISPMIERKGLANAVSGLPLEEGIETLLQNPHIAEVSVSDPQIQSFPSWTPWIKVKEAGYSTKDLMVSGE